MKIQMHQIHFRLKTWIKGMERKPIWKKKEEKDDKYKEEKKNMLSELEGVHWKERWGQQKGKKGGVVGSLEENKRERMVGERAENPDIMAAVK